MNDAPAAGAANVEPMPARTLVFNLANKRYTEDGLGQELAKLMGALHKAGEIVSADYNLHGLRHTRGVELALAGCTDAQGAAMLGHSSPSSFAQYRRQADRIRLAEDGAALIVGLRERMENADLQKNLQKTCKTSSRARVGSAKNP
jgi:hypothetical protein